MGPVFRCRYYTLEWSGSTACLELFSRLDCKMSPAVPRRSRVGGAIRSPRSRSEPAHSSPSPQGQDALRRPQLAGRRQGRAAPPCNATRTTTAASLPAWKVSPPAHRLQNDRHLPQVLVLRGRRNATSGRRYAAQSARVTSSKAESPRTSEGLSVCLRQCSRLSSRT
jgi:hypothetical protein